MKNVVALLSPDPEAKIARAGWKYAHSGATRKKEDDRQRGQCTAVRQESSHVINTSMQTYADRGKIIDLTIRAPRRWISRVRPVPGGIAHLARADLAERRSHPRR